MKLISGKLYRTLDGMWSPSYSDPGKLAMVIPIGSILMYISFKQVGAHERNYKFLLGSKIRIVIFSKENYENLGYWLKGIT